MTASDGFYFVLKRWCNCSIIMQKPARVFNYAIITIISVTISLLM